MDKLYNDDLISETDLYDVSVNNIDNSITIDAITQYLNDISKYNTYSVEEEQNIFQKYKSTGDINIKNDIINHNLKLVVFAAKKYSNTGIDLLDIIQFGNIGLMDAIDKYDVNLGYKFSTYALWWIKRAILTGLADMGRSIRVPGYIIDQYRKNMQARATLEKELNRIPSDVELVNYINTNNLLVSSINEMTVDKLKECNNALLNNNTISLSSPLDFGDGPDDMELEEIVAGKESTPEETYIHTELGDILLEVMNQVLDKPIHREIMLYRFGWIDNVEHTIVETADKFNLSPERIRMIEAKSLRKIRGSQIARQLLSGYYADAGFRCRIWRK